MSVRTISILFDCEANLACLQCGKPLTGNQTKYCCGVCKCKHVYAANKEEQRALARDRMTRVRAKDPDAYRVYMQNWKRANTDKVRASRRSVRAKELGLTVAEYAARVSRDQDAIELRKINKLVVANARQAWRHWLKVKAPIGWLARYWKAEGRPWKNTRIKAAARLRIRRRLDEEFRQYDILRAGHKKELKKRRSDGTVSVAALLKERTTCPYCAVKLTRKNVVMDHIIPLAKGGAHSAANIVACCRPCNTKKQAKEFVVWVQSLEPHHRKRADDMYVKKMGAMPEQQVMRLW